LAVDEFRLREDTPDAREFASQFPEMEESLLEALTGLSAGESKIQHPDSSALTTRIVPLHERQRSRHAQLTKVDRYRIQRKLGEGGYGTVHLAEDPELKRQVAIKIWHVRRAQPSADLTGTLEEARILAQLDHPAIVPVYDVGRTEDNAW